MNNDPMQSVFAVEAAAITGDVGTESHRGADIVLQAIEGVGLNMAQLMTDMGAPEVVAQRVEQDRNDAISMKVTATPDYFVNSRPLPSFGDQQLLNLVREELQKAY